MLDSADEAKGDSLEVVCAVEHTEILFLTGEHIGVRRTTSQTEECEPRGGRYDIVPAVTKWGSDSSLALARVAGAGADSAYVRAARAAIASAPVDCEPFVTAERGNDTAEMMDSWYVARDRGRWSAFAYDHIYGSECDLDGGIDLRLPVSFTGHDGLRPSWDVLSRSVPGLIDAFSSPSGDLVVAIVPDSLLAFESDGARLGARLLAIPLPHERIVMAEWAVGAHVTRWDLMIGRLRASLRSARVLSPSR